MYDKSVKAPQAGVEPATLGCTLVLKVPRSSQLSYQGLHIGWFSDQRHLTPLDDDGRVDLFYKGIPEDM